jgi:NADP-dependent 3-hydroxy acid dehydrogenase YdfG
VSGRDPNERQLVGQTVVVLGSTSGIGLETARRARHAGAEVILAARDPDRLHRIGLDLGASISAFDLSDTNRLMRFFTNLPGLTVHGR